MLIDRDDALRRLNAVVEKMGFDHTYDNSDASIDYVDYEWRPMCILGHLFLEIDPDLAPVMAEAHSGIRDFVVEVQPWVFRVFDSDIYLTGEALELLSDTQEHQDAYEPWGPSVQKASAEMHSQ